MHYKLVDNDDDDGNIADSRRLMKKDAQQRHHDPMIQPSLSHLERQLMQCHLLHVSFVNRLAPTVVANSHVGDELRLSNVIQ